MAQVKYTDIGHAHPNDILWILVDGDMWTMPAGQSRTHELIWGGDVKIEDHWRGRYDMATAYCSIAPPKKSIGRRRPPETLLSELRSRFSIVRFYYFADGVQSFSPNPKRVKTR